MMNLKEMDYQKLQEKAKEAGIKANQKKKVLIQALEALEAEKAPQTINKEEKRTLTWSEIPGDKITKEGREITTFLELLQPLKMERYKGIIGNRFFIPGYMDNPESHSPIKVFGLTKTQHNKIIKGKENGILYHISTGQGNNKGMHLSFIKPNNPLEILLKDKKTTVELNEKNYLNIENIISHSNHGRHYKFNILLSMKYNLLFYHLSPGNYLQSTKTIFNLDYNDIKEEWEIYTISGDIKKLGKSPQKIFEEGFNKGIEYLQNKIQ